MGEGRGSDKKKSSQVRGGFLNLGTVPKLYLVINNDAFVSFDLILEFEPFNCDNGFLFLLFLICFQYICSPFFLYCNLLSLLYVMILKYIKMIWNKLRLSWVKLNSSLANYARCASCFQLDCCLILRSSSIEVVLHWGHILLRLSSIEVVFYFSK